MGDFFLNFASLSENLDFNNHKLKNASLGNFLYQTRLFLKIVLKYYLLVRVVTNKVLLFICSFWSYWYQNLHWKLGQQVPSFGSILAFLETNGLKNFFFRNKTFLFFKIESWNFQQLFENDLFKPHKISTHSAYSDNCYFHFYYRLSDWVEILWGLRFHQILFQKDAENQLFIL